MKTLLNEIIEIFTKVISLLLVSLLVIVFVLSITYESFLLLFKFIHTTCKTKFKKKYIVFLNKGNKY